MKKLKKRITNFVITIIILVVVAILFISPFTKYLIEKYDQKYTGRQITMGWAYVNPFTGYIHFSNFKIYEFKSDSIFFSVNGLRANLNMAKLFSKTHEISELTLEHPRAIVIQNKNHFNFSDLVEKFSSKADSVKTKTPVHFNILDIKISEGEFYYHETTTPINYFIKNVNLSSSGVRWNVDTVPITFSFLSGIGSGDMKGTVTVNSKNNDYKLAVVVHKFDLNIVGQYIKDFSNYGSFKAYLDADFKSNGNLIDLENVTHSGLLSISDFHFGKNLKEDFTSFDNLTIAIKEISPLKKVYLFDSISLKHPYFKYERYDHLDNVQTMFGEKGSNIKDAKDDSNKFNLIIEIVEYLKVISKNLFKSNYRVGKLLITNGNIRFNDYSLSEKFGIELSSLSIIADSIDKLNNRVEVAFKSDINPYGNIAIDLSINPRDSSDFDLNYHLKKKAITMFNPYFINYTSFPLDRGIVELRGNWQVKNGNINSNNHLLIIDPRIANRLKHKDTKWIPMKLIMFFIRERGNVIDYEVPINGNLNNPAFNLQDVIIDVLQNIFIKPISAPYTIDVKNVETEVEKSLFLKWEMNSDMLVSKQIYFIEKMITFLEDNPSASINIYPNYYSLKEKEYIVLFEAKKLYFMKCNNKNTQSLNREDSIAINKMSIKDSLFIDYLDSKGNDSLVFTIQEKCIKIIGLNTINKLFKQLNTKREKLFINYFTNKGVEKQIKILEGEAVIPFNGFSFFKIEYKGQFPEYLLKAYQKINELNNEAPRDKFKEHREKNMKI